jgi:hypothetical protein
MSLSEMVGQLEDLLTSLAKDLMKVGKGNKSASQRVRVATLKLEKVGKRFRKESVNIEKGGKPRRSKKKAKKRKR